MEVDCATLADPLLRAPTYRVVARRLWTGTEHTQLYGEIRALADHWRARRVVVDATGVGAGLAAFLARALPGRVQPFLFNAASKSRLGWDFLALVDGGRFKDYASDMEDALQRLFVEQLTYTRLTRLPGVGQRLRWGVPDGTRHPQTGTYLHDDLVLSAALCAVLDGLPWSAVSGSGIVRAPDPLDDMRGF